MRPAFASWLGRAHGALATGVWRLARGSHGEGLEQACPLIARLELLGSAIPGLHMQLAQRLCRFAECCRSVVTVALEVDAQPLCCIGDFATSTHLRGSLWSVKGLGYPTNIWLALQSVCGEASGTGDSSRPTLFVQLGAIVQDLQHESEFRHN